MLKINIPGGQRWRLHYVVLDYNGTLAKDGALTPNMRQLCQDLSHYLQLYVVTADTHGSVRQQLSGLPVRTAIIPRREQIKAKADFVKRLRRSCVAIGNGRNDAAMLQQADLGIAVTGAEGAAREAMATATVVVNSCENALEMLLYPKRLEATLRA